MTIISAKEARAQFSSLLSRVESGEEVFIARRGKIIAGMKNPGTEKGRGLPSLRKFRQNVKVKGKPLSNTVVSQRNEERY